jgi:hypothetical protein
MESVLMVIDNFKGKYEIYMKRQVERNNFLENQEWTK